MTRNLEPTEQSIMTLSFKTLSINLTLKGVINPKRKPYHKTVFTFINNTIKLLLIVNEEVPGWLKN